MKGQGRMDKPEQLATLDTQDTGQINVREYWRGNEEWTSQRNWQHWTHNTQDKYTLENIEGATKNGQARETGSIGHTRHRTKASIKINTTHNTKKISTTYPPENRGWIQVVVASYKSPPVLGSTFSKSMCFTDDLCWYNIYM